MSGDYLAKVVILLGSAAAVLSVGETCLAANAQGTGKIIIYHLNGQIADRGACIQMNPPLPGIGGWACVFTANNNLFDQLNDLFRDAYLSAKDCVVNVETSDVNLSSINWAQCM
jgi:hypothetical protein